MTTLKLYPESPQLVVIGSNYSNDELVRMLEHSFPQPSDLLQLAINRIASVDIPNPAPTHVQQMQREELDPTEVFDCRCPACGCKLLLQNQS